MGASRDFAVQFHTTQTNFSFKTAYLSAFIGQKAQFFWRTSRAFVTFAPVNIFSGAGGAAIDDAVTYASDSRSISHAKQNSTLYRMDKYANAKTPHSR